MIALLRTGGMRMPQFREVLEISEDGAFEMWRSVSMASALPSPIGRFAGHVPDKQHKALAAAAKRAAAGGSLTSVISPDSPVDRIQVDGVTATLGIHDSGEGSWSDIAKPLRALLKDLTESPDAAIALEVDGGAKLVHRGTKPLELDLSKLTIKAVQWRGGSTEAQWAGRVTDRGVESASLGWSLELPFDHGFAIRDGDRITATVTFSARDKDRLVPVSLQTP